MRTEVKTHKEENEMLKAGMIRCQQTEDMCPGNTDFKVAKEGKLAFEETGPVEVVEFVSCRLSLSELCQYAGCLY